MILKLGIRFLRASVNDQIRILKKEVSLGIGERIVRAEDHIEEVFEDASVEVLLVEFEFNMFHFGSVGIPTESPFIIIGDGVADAHYFAATDFGSEKVFRFRVKVRFLLTFHENSIRVNGIILLLELLLENSLDFGPKVLKELIEAEVFEIFFEDLD